MVEQLPIAFASEQIREFCRKWRITEFSLFGSVLREDFRPDSDVDAIVNFAEGSHWGLFDICRMEEELRSIFQRDVDLVTRKSIEQSENYIRSREVLGTRRVIHAAG
ncbi:MAG: nucleotidyltransferase domain-containing protein [Phycisphaerales bacterium]|nr:nucleotidyltransferase domain-containing protein [Phycisphaerales bacterium]